MKLINIKRKIAFFIINHLYPGTYKFSLKRKLLIWCGYLVGENTKIVGPIFITSDLKIGDNCWIGHNFCCHGNGHVIIGNNCDIAPNVTFCTGGHAIGGEERRAGVGEEYSITVKDGVWIGINSTLCKSITVDSSSIIGACSLVIKDVKKNSIVAGIPAKEIRDLKNEKNTKKVKK